MFLEKAESFIKTVDFEEIESLFINTIYYIPIPSNYENHMLDNWMELEDDEELHWSIPTIDTLKHIIFNLVAQVYYQSHSDKFGPIECIYNEKNDNVTLCFDDLLEEYKWIVEMENKLKYDQTYILPNKNYVGNCSKEFCELIVEKYWEREYERIQYIDFPPTQFKKIEEKHCINEIKSLLQCKPDKATQKGISNIIKKFHKSMIFANIKNKLSPFDGWQQIKNDPELFKKFYRNRLRCSDWFKEDGHTKYLLHGVVMEETYGIGLSTSRMFQYVTYFKPRLAKYIVNKYLSEYNTVFDPFSGYSGRMLGVLSSNKNYIGHDLCESSILESKDIYKFISQFINNTCELHTKDAIKTTGKYECLFTCPPYENIENWPGVKSVNYNCDKWIDICLSNYDCERYVFVTDNKIKKYKKYIKEEICNTSHFAANIEYIVVIDKIDLKDIFFDLDGDKINVPVKDRAYTNLGIDLYNIFNQENFNKYISYPNAFDDWINIIYKKFNNELLGHHEYFLPKIKLNNINNNVLLACSGGLDSIYQAIQLKEMGYNPIYYHIKNVNSYENGNSYKSLLNASKKLNIELITGELVRNYKSNYNKHWAENPIKNQMILFTMIDYCKENNINKICMDGSWEFNIDDVTAGIDVADAPENYELWLNGINEYVDNLEFIKTSHDISKFDKIKYLDNIGLMDDIYSCLGAGRFNEYRHNIIETKYNIKLFAHNCGCYCRKCAHHNLLMHYSNYKKFPDEFIDKCWNIMNNNGFASRNMLFGDDIPIEQKIKNLFVE